MNIANVRSIEVSSVGLCGACQRPGPVSVLIEGYALCDSCASLRSLDDLSGVVARRCLHCAQFAPIASRRSQYGTTTTVGQIVERDYGECRVSAPAPLDRGIDMEVHTGNAVAFSHGPIAARRFPIVRVIDFCGSFQPIERPPT